MSNKDCIPFGPAIVSHFIYAYNRECVLWHRDRFMSGDIDVIQEDSLKLLHSQQVIRTFNIGNNFKVLLTI